MKLVWQTKSNDCGLAVLEMVYFALYKQKANLIANNENHKLLQKAGLTIYDLEILAQANNIHLESYEVPLSQLVKLHYEQPFITLIKTEHGHHYVVAKHNKASFQIYDPIKGEYELTLSDFGQQYQNIFIVYKKALVKNQSHNQISKIHQVAFLNLPPDLLFWTLLLLFDLLNLAIGLVGSGLIKVIFQFVTDNIYQNLLFILFYFLLLYAVEVLLNYFLGLYKAYKLEQLMKRNIIFYVNYLAKKSKLFYIQVPKEELYQYPQAIGVILNYKYLQKPNFWSDTIFLIILFGFLTYLSYYYLIFAIGYAAISLLCSYFAKKYRTKNFEQNNLLKNKLDYTFHHFYNYLENEQNQKKWQHYAKTTKTLYWQNSQQIMQNATFFADQNLLAAYGKKLVYLVCITLAVFFLLKNLGQTEVELSQLLFALTLLALFDDTTTSIFNYFANYSDYAKNEQLLERFAVFENKHHFTSQPGHQKLQINKITSIHIENLTYGYPNKPNLLFQNYNLKLQNGTLLYGKNGIGKSTLLKIIGHELPIDQNSEITYNNINQIDLDWTTLEDKIYYVPSDPTTCHVDYESLISGSLIRTEKVAAFLKATKLSAKQPAEYSKGEIQLANLLNLVDLENCLILLDEAFTNISAANIALYMRLFWQDLIANNFVITVSHNLALRKYFQKCVEIKNVCN